MKTAAFVFAAAALAAAAAALAARALAQTPAAAISPVPQLQFFDNSGRPLAGGCVQTFAAGTTTPLASYQNSTGTANTNPIVLDAAGRANIWLGPVAYKFAVRAAAPGCASGGGATLYTVDNIRDWGFSDHGQVTSNTAAIAALAAAGGDALVGFLQNGTGAILITVHQKLLQMPKNVDEFGASISAQTGSVDTLFTALTKAQQSLAVITDYPNTVYKGEVDLSDTGVPTNAYNLAQTFQMSSQMHLRGIGGTSSVKIGLASTPAFSGNYMINIINANSGGDPNTNFDTQVSNIVFDAKTNNPAQAKIGCLSLPLSVASTIHDIGCYTFGVGLMMGGVGPGGPTVDNTVLDNINIGLVAPTVGPMTAQGIVFPQPQTASGGNTNQLRNIKIAGVGAANGCASPAFEVGAVNYTIDVAGINIEQAPCPVMVGQVTNGIHITNLTMGPDCSPCDPQKWPWGVLVDPSALDVKINGIFYGYRVGLALGSWWRPGVPYALGSGASQPVSATVIDDQGYIQQVTACAGACTSGATRPAWNHTPGGTTADGNLTWTNQGLIKATCNGPLHITNNCGFPTLQGGNYGTPPANGSQELYGLLYYGTATAPFGAASPTDATWRVFSYDSAAFFNQLPTGAHLLGADFNSTADQPVSIPFPPGLSRAIPRRIVISNASVPVDAAIGGIYSGAGKTGCEIVPATQMYPGLTSSLSYVDAAVQNCGALLSVQSNPIYFSLTTPQGVAATADITMQFDYLP
jgi:hypothetical protein